MQKTAYEVRISDWSSDVCSSDLWDQSSARPLPLQEEGAMMPLKRVLPALILVVGLAACTESKPPAPPTEQQIHSSDSAVATGEMGRHPYRCSDGEPLFVDYKDNGLQIDLRRPSGAVPMTLPAPAQSEEPTSELQSLMRISYAVFCLKKKKKNTEL